MGDRDRDRQYKYRQEIQQASWARLTRCMLGLTNLALQMMYVSGETGEPSPETTGLIEDIVRQQVVELVSRTHLTILRMDFLLTASSLATTVYGGCSPSRISIDLD